MQSGGETKEKNEINIERQVGMKNKKKTLKIIIRILYGVRKSKRKIKKKERL